MLNAFYCTNLPQIADTFSLPQHATPGLGRVGCHMPDSSEASQLSGFWHLPFTFLPTSRFCLHNRDVGIISTAIEAIERTERSTKHRLKCHSKTSIVDVGKTMA